MPVLRGQLEDTVPALYELEVMGLCLCKVPLHQQDRDVVAALVTGLWVKCTGPGALGLPVTELNPIWSKACIAPHLGITSVMLWLEGHLALTLSGHSGTKEGHH